MFRPKRLWIALGCCAVATVALIPTADAGSDTTHYTAQSCSGGTDGACLYNSGKSLSGWDPGGAENKTLRDWAYHSSSTSIGNTLYSVQIRYDGKDQDNCDALNVFQKADLTGPYHFIAGPGGTLPSAYQDNVGSIAWPC